MATITRMEVGHGAGCNRQAPRIAPQHGYQSVFRPYRIGQAGRKTLSILVLASIFIRRVSPYGRTML
jgi:hypothetical protein